MITINKWGIIEGYVRWKMPRFRTSAQDVPGRTGTVDSLYRYVFVRVRVIGLVGLKELTAS
jgi:hypothetical protein